MHDPADPGAGRGGTQRPSASHVDPLVFPGHVCPQSRGNVDQDVRAVEQRGQRRRIAEIAEIAEYRRCTQRGDSAGRVLGPDEYAYGAIAVDQSWQHPATDPAGSAGQSDLHGLDLLGSPFAHGVPDPTRQQGRTDPGSVGAWLRAAMRFTMGA
ncbi:hypothetical protein BH24ACT9_BH24ACT9_03550 [soil metagenome]